MAVSNVTAMSQYIILGKHRKIQPRHLSASFSLALRRKIFHIALAMRPGFLLVRMKNLRQSEGLFYQSSLDRCLLTYDRNRFFKCLRELFRILAAGLSHIGTSTAASADGFCSRLDDIARMCS